MPRPGYEIYDLPAAVLAGRGRALLVPLLHLLMKFGELRLLLGRQHRVDLREELRVRHLKLDVDCGAGLRRRAHGRLVESAGRGRVERVAGAGLGELLVQALRALLEAVFELFDLRLLRVGQVQDLREVAEQAAARASGAVWAAWAAG